MQGTFVCLSIAPLLLLQDWVFGCHARCYLWYLFGVFIGDVCWQCLFGGFGGMFVEESALALIVTYNVT